MKENKKNKEKIIIFFSITVVVLTVVYLFMSSTITIKGYNNMDSACWDVHFENLKGKTLGDAKIVRNAKIIDKNTYIGDYEVILTKPGDAITYTFDVVNKGTLDARLKDIIMSNIKCKSITNSKKDENIVCDNLVYEIKYKNGNKLRLNDKLDSGERKTLNLTLKYDGNLLPNNDVKIYNVTTILLYNQK